MPTEQEMRTAGFARRQATGLFELWQNFTTGVSVLRDTTNGLVYSDQISLNAEHFLMQVMTLDKLMSGLATVLHASGTITRAEADAIINNGLPRPSRGTSI